MKWKAGDRYKRINRLSKVVNSIWERTGEFEGVCVVSTNRECSVGDVGQWMFEDSSSWEYLGNFSKENNFNQLYNLFNDDN